VSIPARATNHVDPELVVRQILARNRAVIAGKNIDREVIGYEALSRSLDEYARSLPVG